MVVKVTSSGVMNGRCQPGSMKAQDHGLREIQAADGCIHTQGLTWSMAHKELRGHIGFFVFCTRCTQRPACDVDEGESPCPSAIFKYLRGSRKSKETSPTTLRTSSRWIFETREVLGCYCRNVIWAGILSLSVTESGETLRDLTHLVICRTEGVVKCHSDPFRVGYSSSSRGLLRW